MIRAILQSGEMVERGGYELIPRLTSSEHQFLWLDIEGSLDHEQHHLLALGVHELAFESLRHNRQMPKTESFPQNHLIVFREALELADDLALTGQNCSMICGANFVVTVRLQHSEAVESLMDEHEYQSFDSASHLATKLMQKITSNYLLKILQFEEKLEELEDQLQSGSKAEAINQLVNLRHHFRRLNRVVEFNQDVISKLDANLTPDFPVNSTLERHEWQMLKDRSKRLVGLVRMYYEICGDLLEGHISISTHDLNNTMKVLTMITAIFVPLGFIAGIYGMNFEYMPELSYRYAYYFTLAGMGVTATIFFSVFKWKKWI